MSYRIKIGSGIQCNKVLNTLSAVLAYISQYQMTTLVETGTARIYRITKDGELLIAEFNLDGLPTLPRGGTNGTQ